MCELATISTIASVAGTAMTAYGSIQQGKAAKAQGEYNARVSENNAQRARNKGTDQENNFRLKTQQLRKQQEAQFGANGVQLGSGSAADILADTDNFGEVDALNIRSNTDSEVEGYLTDANNSRIQGNNAQRAGNVGAFSSVLSNVGTVSSKWYRHKKKSPSFDVGLSTNNNMGLM